MSENEKIGFFKQLYGDLPREVKGLGLVLGVALLVIFPAANSFGLSGYLGALVFLALVAILMAIIVVKARKEAQSSEIRSMQPFEILDNISDVTPRLVGILKEELGRRGSVEVYNMALDMETVVPWLNYQLIQDEGIRNVNFRALVVNPDTPSPTLRQMIDGQGGNVRASTARASINSLLQLTEDPLLGARGLSLELKTYDLPPLFHGFLVADRHLFISFVEIDSGRLRGANFPYLYLRFDTDSRWVKHYFSFYRKWFSFYWQQGAVAARFNGR